MKLLWQRRLLDFKTGPRWWCYVSNLEPNGGWRRTQSTFVEQQDASVLQRWMDARISRIRRYLNPPWVIVEQAAKVGLGLTALPHYKLYHVDRNQCGLFEEHSSHTAETVVRLCEDSQLKEAVDILEKMDHEGIWSLGTETYRILLLECMKKRALAEGKRVHSHIRKAGLQSDFYLGVILVRMYCACGKMGMARNAFDKARSFADDERKKNVFIWTVLIRGYVRLGHNVEALRVFREMIKYGIKPDKFVLVTALSACTSMTNLEDGRQIHEEAIRSGFGPDPFVNNALIDMYGKCGSTKSARIVFDQMERHNIVSWNALISGYAHNGHGTQALTMFQEMQQDGLKPDRSTYVSVLKACAQLLCPEKGKHVHDLITDSGFAGDVHLGAALVEMYVACGSIQDAFSLFEEMPRKTLALWTVMIKGAAKYGLHKATVDLFKQMQEDEGRATTETAVCTLDACATLQNLEGGKKTHDLIVKSGCVVDADIVNALIDMYSRCGCLKSAQQTFYRMPHKNITSWNTIMKGCIQNGQSKEALKLYKHLLLDELKPDLETYINALDACGSLASPERGKRVHAHAVKKGMGEDLNVVAAVVEMYISCGCTSDAVQALSSVSRPEDVSWANFLTRHSSRKFGKETINFLEEMEEKHLKSDMGPEIKIELSH